MAAPAKRFEYAVRVDRASRLFVDDAPPLALDEPWTPDDLLLAGLALCTIQSLRYHAERAGLDVVADASASGVVTKRDEDGRYAFVEIQVDIAAELESGLPEEALADLLAKAERDCFVGASLTVKPRYRWTVNDHEVPARATPS